VSSMRRLDQDLAKAAAEILQPRISADLRTRYRQLPMMLRMSGLAATIAYLVSKAGKPGASKNGLEEAYSAVVDGIRRRLIERYGQPVPTAPTKPAPGPRPGPAGPVPGSKPATRTPDLPTSGDGLVVWLAKLPASQYARAAAEVEALAIWLSRLAEARYKATADDHPSRPSRSDQTGTRQNSSQQPKPGPAGAS
jgi:CRISPR type III-B/RAMP module-associated protein Cmr5